MTRGQINTGEETPLRAWCERHDASILSVARRLRLSFSTVYNWFTGKRLPDLVNAFRLEKLTEGGVPAVSWLGTARGSTRYSEGIDIDREARQRLESKKRFYARKRAAR